MNISKGDRDYVKSIHKSSTLYETLRVKPNSSPKEIRESFRFLSKKIHPDKNKAPGSTEAFKKLNNAYQTLINDESRHDFEKCNNNEHDSDDDDIIIIIVGTDGRSYCPGMNNFRGDKRERRRFRRQRKPSNRFNEEQEQHHHHSHRDFCHLSRQRKPSNRFNEEQEQHHHHSHQDWQQSKTKEEILEVQDQRIFFGLKSLVLAGMLLIILYFWKEFLLLMVLPPFLAGFIFLIAKIIASML